MGNDAFSILKTYDVTEENFCDTSRLADVLLAATNIERQDEKRSYHVIREEDILKIRAVAALLREMAKGSPVPQAFIKEEETRTSPR